ncbi:MAG TPA: histidine kinase [Chitinophagaceae bacterium]|nr:histidine kinase [Chitinophagaceae bacterium]
MINVTKWSLIAFLVCIYCLSFVLPLVNVRAHLGDYIFPAKELINLGIAIGIFLLNYFVLLPELFAKKHFIFYSFCVVVLILFIICQQVFVEYQAMDEMGDRFFTAPVSGGAAIVDSNFVSPAFMPVGHPGPMMELTVPIRYDFRDLRADFFMDIILPQTLLKSSFLAVIIFFAGGFFTAGTHWLRTDLQKEELQKKQLESELKFLKAQINPHFLFNCLNSIYMLTRKDAEQARFGIHRLSSFLRYLLRASELNKVPVLWEIEAIEDYVSLQQTRLPGHVNIHCKIVKTDKELVIEPMLLLPLIENVFKHGIDAEKPGDVHIELGIQGNELKLVTINPIVEKPVKVVSGIGIRNIESRLAISYPGRAEVAYIQTSTEFIVKLSIRLDDELHNH